MKVHSALKNGFPEIIYQRALAVEFQKSGISFSKEHEMTIFYEGVNVGTRKADFFVDDKILVELKATSELTDIHTYKPVQELSSNL